MHYIHLNLEEKRIYQFPLYKFIYINIPSTILLRQTEGILQQAKQAITRCRHLPLTCDISKGVPEKFKGFLRHWWVGWSSAWWEEELLGHPTSQEFKWWWVFGKSETKWHPLIRSYLAKTIWPVNNCVRNNVGGILEDKAPFTFAFANLLSASQKYIELLPSHLPVKKISSDADPILAKI